MVDVFENAVSIFIHDKDVRSIKTLDGTVVWEKQLSGEVIATIIGDECRIGSEILYTGDGVHIDWGDGTSDIHHSTGVAEHYYEDGKESHTVTLSGGITGLGSCFYDLSGLTSVSIPNTITSFGENCFHGCTGLTSIVIPNSITSLGEGCFSLCSNLSTVSIPNTISTIPINCFSSCWELVDYQLYWVGNNVPSYNVHYMPNNTNTTFTIPNGSTEDYVAKGYPSDKLVERSE